MSNEAQSPNPEPVEGDTGVVPDDTMSVADMIGEQMEVGHGGIPIFWIVSVILVFVWALVAWKPWRGY